MMNYTLISFGVAIIVHATIAFVWARSRTNSNKFLPLPPGPPGLPMIGHALIMPRATNFPWKTFSEWGKKWGGLIYVNVLWKPMVIINDLHIARELLEKRGLIYSDRPNLVLISEMMGWDKVVAFKGYNDNDFRVQRKMMQQHFSARAVQSLRDVQCRELHILLDNLSQSPDNFLSHIHRYTTATIMSVTYGYTIDSDDDPYATLIEKAVTMTVESGPAGGTLFDFFPFLQFLPAWMLGAGLKRHALKTRELVDESLSKPFNLVKDIRASGVAISSIISSLLDEIEEDDMMKRNLDIHENNIKAVGGNSYAAGFETTAASLLTFILAMVLHPEVAQKAQTEIDRFVGAERMPTPEDREQLPYIDCILKEILRWNPPLPLGLPHRITENDVYDGMHIPEGSMIIPNIWQFTRDERDFPEPNRFYPDRFLQKTGADLSDETPILSRSYLALGDGAPLLLSSLDWICPGEFMVEAGVWITIACALAVFDFKPPVDQNGCEFMPVPCFKSGATSHPEKFQCRIVPRSEKHIRLMQQLARACA